MTRGAARSRRIAVLAWGGQRGRWGRARDVKGDRHADEVRRDIHREAVMRVRRLPIVDEFLEDGRAAVYADTGVVVLLSELATAAWEVLDESWTSSLLVAAHLVDEFGPPGDGGAEDLTDQTLRSLAERSLVELDQGE